MRLHGLYAITDTQLCPGAQLALNVTAALHGGARIIQYRDKGSDSARRLRAAQSLVDICHSHNALLIINDDVELAAACRADGVHLGQDDVDLARARERLGTEATIGVSCYNDMERARNAALAGADYVAFGRFFPSQTKPDANAASRETLSNARRELDLPLVAIGGITPDNGGLLIEAGADMLAVIHGVFGQPDIAAAARRYAALFE